MHITDPDYAGPGSLDLPPDEVHVWRIDLDTVGAGEDRWRQLLSPEEQTRAQAFRFEPDRRRYTTVRAWLRTLLGAYISRNPRELLFAYSDKGKPALRPFGDHAKLQFNISHSGDASLLAFTRDRDLGIDIEKIRQNLDVEGIARRFFSESEQRQLVQMTPEDRYSAFFRCWTRKEAYLKATGAGFSLPLGQFDVSIAYGERQALLETRPDPNEASRWSLTDIPAGDGYAGALCVRGHGWELKGWGGESRV